MPGRVVDLIEFQLIRLARRDLELPLTEWADLKSDSVNEAWENFLDTVEDHVRLPAYKLVELIQKIVNRTYPLLVWPRTRIVKYLFGKKEVRDYETLRDKVGHMPFNQQLGRAVTRYMEKKGFEELSREKGREVIEKVDEKMTRRYSREQWYESIRPLFELACGPVPRELLASYFHHRGQAHWSNLMAEEKGMMSKEDFRAWLEQESSPSPHESTADAEPAASHSRDESGSDLNTSFNADKESKQNTAGEEPVTVPIEREQEESGSHEQQPDVARDHSGEQRAEEEEPIWRRFLSREDTASVADESLEMDSAEEVEDTAEIFGHQLNEVFKPEDEEEERDSRFQQLQSYLKRYEEYYIREIFRGSASDYKKALRQLTECEDWREAYPFIDREIFERNDVDLYSDVAVHFTDMMQTYFSDT